MEEKEYCDFCGKEMETETECQNCKKKKNSQCRYGEYDPIESKVWIGVLSCVCLSLLGLLLGLLLYPYKTYSRRTFIRGWLYTFIVELSICIIILIVYWQPILEYLKSIFVK